MKTINYQTLQETLLYYEQMDNGLNVYLLPKKGFQKLMVSFQLIFGSIDTTFVPIWRNRNDKSS